MVDQQDTEQERHIRANDTRDMKTEATGSAKGGGNANMEDSKMDIDKPKSKERNETSNDQKDQNKRRKVGNEYLHGYDYKGEEPKVGVILALRSERFNHKVIYSSFIDKLKNYVLSHFDDAKDVVPIIEELRDPTQEVIDNEPIELVGTQKTNQIKIWMKQEEVKQHVKCINNLKNNMETLYALVWGQCTTGLQEAIKADPDYEDHAKV